MLGIQDNDIRDKCRSKAFMQKTYIFFLIIFHENYFHQSIYIIFQIGHYYAYTLQ